MKSELTEGEMTGARLSARVGDPMQVAQARRRVSSRPPAAQGIQRSIAQFVPKKRNRII